MSKSEKGGGNNMTRQHYQIATGSGKTGLAKGGPVKAAPFAKGARVAPKRK